MGGLSIKNLYILRDDARLEQREEELQIVAPQMPKEHVPVAMVASVMVLGRAQVTTQALRLCLTNGIPLHYGTHGGKLLGTCLPYEKGRLELRLRQYAAYQDDKYRLSLARAFLQGKVRRQLMVIQAYRKRLTDAPAQERYFEGQLAKAAKVKSMDALLGLEGEMARRYFAQFGAFLRHMPWQGRSRQPPRDPVNALLSLCYMLVLGDLISAAWGAGFEVGIGFLHAIQSTRPSLACDFLELFRPQIDQFVIQLFNRQEMREEFFEPEGEGVLLQKRRFGLFMTKFDAFRPEVSQYEALLSKLNAALREGRVPDFE